MANNGSSSTTFMNFTIPKPKLKRSYNTAMSFSIISNKSKRSSNPTPPPFEIKTKTIDECAKLIVSKRISHENKCPNKVYRINL